MSGAPGRTPPQIPRTSGQPLVTGGPSKYQGRDLHEAHADLHITEEAFDRLLWLMQETLQELGVQQEDEQAILAEVRARRPAVVTFEESS
jgi:hemoglobin